MLRFRELLKQRLRRVEFERESWFIDGHGGGLLIHLFALEIPLKGIEEQSIMGHTIPVEYFLLLLCANTVVFIQKVQKRALGFFEGCVGARLEIS